MKDTDQVGHTHILMTAEEWACQDTERNRPREAHSHPRYGRGGACQDIEGNRLSEAHSLPGDSKGRELSGHGKEQTERGTLTF